MYFLSIKNIIKRILLFTILYSWQLNANAVNLIEVYKQALVSDPVFQQAIAESMVTRDNVPISISYILPNISLFADPRIARYGFSGTKYRTGSIGNLQFVAPRNFTQRSYNLDLSLHQPVFDFGLYAGILIQLENAKGACAKLNAALQDLMIRVANAYFAVLRDEEEIIYTKASNRYYQFQLNQTTDQYKSGYKTLTDVYTARAAYESSAAALIVAEKKLENDRENLRAITNVYYPHLSSLKMDIPLMSPRPSDVEQWVEIAIMQNWSIKSAQYSLEAARQNIKQQFAGHLPVVTLESSFVRHYVFNINRYPSFTDNYGAGTVSDRSVGFNIDVPIFEGGGVVSKTNQAQHLFQQQCQILEETVRDTTNKTRQSFTNILAGISQIKADEHVINAYIKSLEGTIDRYNSGLQSLLDVLNREELLYRAQVDYAIDRYDYVNNILLLKQAAGTLNFQDLGVVNSWLIDNTENLIEPYQDKLLRQTEATIQKNRLQSKKHKRISKKKSKRYYKNKDIADLMAQMKETKKIYKKLAKQTKQSKTEMTKLKISVSELKRDLQDKNQQLTIALAQVQQLKLSHEDKNKKIS